MRHPSDSAHRGRPTLGALAIIPIMGAISFSHAAEPVLADPDTGRWTTVETPSPKFDQRHLRLTIDATDLSGTPIAMTAEITLAAIGSPRRLIELDAKGLEITGVRIGSRAVEFVHEGNLLMVTLARPAQPGVSLTMTVEYRVSDLAPNGLGLSLWPSPRGPVLSSQGQTDLSSRWFPCIDRPDDRLTSEIAVRTGADLTVLANGTQIDRQNHRDGTATTRWTMRDESPVYLVSVAVGAFDTHRVGQLSNGEPTLVYAQRDLTPEDRDVLERTDDMIRFFALLFDEPFVWDRYDQVYLPGVPWSMEQTTIAFMEESLLGSPALEDVVAHEVAHHWFGNLVTCRSWPHLWLNEGLATYSELLWAEERARTDEDASSTPETARREYTDRWRGAVFADPPGRWPIARPMVTRRYAEPDELFELPDNPYTKGALLLDAVRHRIGDRAFFTALASLIDRHRFGAVETADLRRSFERASGQALERMFDEYTQRPGFPVLGATVEWDASTNTARVQLKQHQLIDSYNPAYTLSVPVRFELGTRTRTVLLPIDSGEVTHEVTLPSAFTGWMLDPERTLFARLSSAHSSSASAPANRTSEVLP